MRLNVKRYLLSASFVALTVGSAQAATVLDFEGTGNDGGEALSNTNTTTSTTFGVTHGSQALNIVGGPTMSLFDIGTVTPTSTGASLAHYNAINSGIAETGGPLQISFDISINTTGVTTDGYFQLILIGNSQNGYFQDGYGNLINGYNIQGQGLSLGTLATNQGATLTATTPYTNGVGTYHFTIPLFTEAQYTAEGHQDDPTFGNSGAPNPYDQFSLSGSGGYAGNVTFAVDNVQIGAAATPEPASLGLLGVVGGALMSRRRRA